MHVLHYCERFSPLSETFIYDSILGLESVGVQCSVITHSREQENERPHPAVHLIAPCGRWHPRRLGNRLLQKAGYASDVEAEWPVLQQRMERVVEKVSPAVVHAHFGNSGVVVSEVTRRLEIPLVVTFYGNDISALPRIPAWRKRFQSLWRTASHILVLSEKMKDEAVRLGCPREKLSVMHLGRDGAKIRFRRPTGPVRRLVSVGRLVPKKGHATAIEAFWRAIDLTGADLRLDIIGDGPEHDSLHDLVRRHGLDEKVRLRGALPNPEVLRSMAEADALLLCSETTASGDQEGTPTVLIEAQLIGLPCISTLHAGIPETVPIENRWLLAPERDVERLAETIRDLARLGVDELADIALTGRNEMEREFDLATQSRKLDSLYRRVLDERARTQLPAA